MKLKSPTVKGIITVTSLLLLLMGATPSANALQSQSFVKTMYVKKTLPKFGLKNIKFRKITSIVNQGDHVEVTFQDGKSTYASLNSGLFKENDSQQIIEEINKYSIYLNQTIRSLPEDNLLTKDGALSQNFLQRFSDLSKIDMDFEAPTFVLDWILNLQQEILQFDLVIGLDASAQDILSYMLRYTDFITSSGVVLSSNYSYGDGYKENTIYYRHSDGTMSSTTTRTYDTDGGENSGETWTKRDTESSKGKWRKKKDKDENDNGIDDWEEADDSEDGEESNSIAPWSEWRFTGHTDALFDFFDSASYFMLDQAFKGIDLNILSTFQIGDSLVRNLNLNLSQLPRTQNTMIRSIQVQQIKSNY